MRAPLIASGPLVEAAFVARPNQLIVEARIGTRLVRAHMADRGRLLGLLIPDARLLLAPRDELGRKTAFQVVGVYNDGELISLDTHLPNRLMAAALAARALPQFARYTCMRREVVVGAHLDLLASLAAAGQRCAVVFVIQRQHAAAFTPDEAIDPAFARALRAAISSGVEVYAYCCPLTPEGLTLGPPVPVYGSLEAVPRPLAMP